MFPPSSMTARIRGSASSSARSSGVSRIDGAAAATGSGGGVGGAAAARRAAIVAGGPGLGGGGGRGGSGAAGSHRGGRRRGDWRRSLAVARGHLEAHARRLAAQLGERGGDQFPLAVLLQQPDGHLLILRIADHGPAI